MERKGGKIIAKETGGDCSTEEKWSTNMRKQNKEERNKVGETLLGQEAEESGEEIMVWRGDWDKEEKGMTRREIKRPSQGGERWRRNKSETGRIKV